MTPRPRLALVPGEPAGVGPELCVMALRASHPCDFTVLGDTASLQAAAARLDVDWSIDAAGDGRIGANVVRLVPVDGACAAVAGKPDPRNAAAVVSALQRAGAGCLDGSFDGMVTGPVHKASINAGGIAFTGTTGLLAAQARCEVVMMLANPLMRVALVTTHLPLRAVADAITAPAFETVLGIVHAALRRDFGIDDPRIAVLGLNPHAGEDGHLGREEIDVLLPVMQRLRDAGMRLQGPLPADTAFLPRRLAQLDVVLAMYHDQGLPVLKYSGFEHAVNITLGLPYPRVAVDHGTALDLAGTGTADPSSLLAAIAACTQLAIHRRARPAAPLTDVAHP